MSLYDLRSCMRTLCGATLVWLLAQPVLAKEIHIPAGDLGSALDLYAKQFATDVVYRAEQVKGIYTQGVDGDLSREQAIKQLLNGTRLTVHMDPSGAMLISTRGSVADEVISPNQKRAKSDGTGKKQSQSVEIFTEEVIVTARKRQETFLDVPVVVTVIGQEALEQNAIYDFFSLASHVPGLVLGAGPPVSGPGISIRGIGTTGTNPTIDQSVSLDIDGLQLSQAYAYEGSMFDVGQVEVMKGPQALFFGKNSPAGVISLRSADPTDKAEVILRTGYETEAMGKMGEAIVSGPVSDTLKLRLAGHYYSDRGYFRNLDQAPAGFGVRTPTSKAMLTNENWVIRGTALFNPSEVYDARLKVNFTHTFINHGDTGQLGYCPGGLTSFTGLPVFDPHEDCTLNRNAYVSWPAPSGFPLVRNNGVPYARSHSEFGTFEQNLHFGEFTLTSVTGLYLYRQSAMETGADSSGVDPFMADIDFYNREVTEEARLTSKFHGPLNFMVGGFYQNGRMTNHPRISGDVALGLPATLIDALHGIDIESISGFGQVMWNVTDKIELAGGARVTHETRDHTELNIGSIAGALGPVTLIDPHIGSTNVSPEVTVTYRPTQDLTLFGSYKQGFKSGSFNTTIYIDPTTRSSFGDEAVKSGEIGLKSRLLNRRLNFNIAGYYSHYTGLQVGSIETTPSGVIALRTINAASAKIKGIDMDLSYAPEEVEGLNLHTALAFNRARYDRFASAPCGGNQTIAQGCNQLFSAADGAFHAQDLTGRSLTRDPKWILTAGIDYEAPVGEDLTLTTGVSVLYSSKFYTSLIDYDTPGFLQGGFAKLNLNLGLKGPNDAWEVSVIANNVTDKITSGNCPNGNLNGALIFGGQQAGKAVGGPAGDDYAVCQVDRGREIWLRLTVRPLSLFRH